MKLYKTLGTAEKEREVVQALKINVKSEDFPKEILDFPNLTELYLEGNCTNFPIHTPFWSKLKILSIKWPSFKGDLSSVFNLPHLENLKIIDTPLSRVIFPIGNIPSPVKSLTIKDCNLSKLPEEFSMLWQLEELNLSGNKLSTLPASFADLRNLKRLNLDSNIFNRFPDLLKAMPKMSHLSIDHNSFSDEEKERIQREFHIWPN